MLKRSSAGLYVIGIRLESRLYCDPVRNVVLQMVMGVFFRCQQVAQPWQMSSREVPD